MKIRVINKSKHSLPDYSIPLSAGMDVRANIEKDFLLKPQERVLLRIALHEKDEWLIGDNFLQTYWGSGGF